MKLLDRFIKTAATYGQVILCSAGHGCVQMPCLGVLVFPSLRRQRQQILLSLRLYSRRHVRGDDSRLTSRMAQRSARSWPDMRRAPLAFQKYHVVSLWMAYAVCRLGGQRHFMDVLPFRKRLLRVGLHCSVESCIGGTGCMKSLQWLA